MIFTDYTKIKKISFKYPELMDKKAERYILETFDRIKENQNNIYTLRDHIRLLEDQIAKDKECLDVVSPMLNVEYSTYEKDYHTENVNIGFNMSSEINKEVH